MTDSRNIQRNLSSMRGSLFNFAMMLTSNSDHAYDLVQDTTVCALREADTLDENNLRSAVMGIMRNIFITNYRRTAQESTHVDTTESVFNLSLASDAGLEAPEGSISTTEAGLRLQKVATADKQTYTLFVKGYTYAEIADELDMPLSEVKAAVRRADRCMR